MADIFNRNLTYAGSILPEKTFLSNTGGLGSGLVTGVRVDYAQQLSRMWSLTTPGKVFIVAGDTQGQFGIDELWGTGSGSGSYPTVCAPGSCSLVGANGLCGTGSTVAASTGSITMEHCVISSYGINGSNGNMQLTKSVGVAFIRLSGT
jgi:hypothetical protein